ncbi:hypothetical protein BBW65_02140 [Helicobacter enhydrae]|uniref:Autotransporter domain-containing protein n=1 Tax=Helicobacter enhydrae TaxID=222136 RepID=A0A1B1U4G6_9HELI|nr:autotransporter outer membrane beta-barrel domain-containing protein [Helicobacter enhydrae]ANV97677.1 hypothetical protein BBW65_02140 [Helicobacter enhydrae]
MENANRQSSSYRNCAGGGIMKPYKPIIATSLALALSVSVASATDTPCNDSSSGICYNTDGGVAFQSTNQVTIDGTSTFNQLKAGGNTLDSLTLKFQKNNPTPPTFASNTLTLGGDKAQFKLTNKGNGLQLGDSGQGTLTIDFGAIPFSTPPSRKATLVFEGITDGVALKGNLNIKAGDYRTLSDGDKVEATFNGDMIGNIKIESQLSGGLYSQLSTNFNFTGASSLKGNLETISIGELKNRKPREQNFVFDNGGIEGSIITSGGLVEGGKLIGRTDSHDYTKVNITFNGTNNSIKKGTSQTAEIRAEGGDGKQETRYNAHNRILFKNKGTIGENTNRVSIIAAPRQESQVNADGTHAYNLIAFKQQATLYLDKLEIKHRKQTNYRNVISLDFAGGSTAAEKNALDINTIITGNYDKKDDALARVDIGFNLIGKGLLKFRNSGVDNTAKDLDLDPNVNTPEEIDKEAQQLEAQLMQPTHAKTLIAKGKLKVGTITTIAEGGGINGIFIENLEVTNGIFANRSKNIISIGSGESTIGANGISDTGATSGDYAIYTGASATNIINLEDSANLTIAKNIGTTGGGTTTFNLNGTNTTLTLEGANNTISTLNLAGTAATLKLVGGADSTNLKTTEVATLNGVNAANLEVNFASGHSKLKLGGSNNTLQAIRLGEAGAKATLSISSENVADTAQAGGTPTHAYNTLTITTLNAQHIDKGSYTFQVYASSVASASGKYADRIVIDGVTGGSTGTQKQNLGVRVKSVEETQTLNGLVAQGKKIALATVRKKSGENAALIKFDATRQEIAVGGESFAVTLTPSATDQQGEGSSGNYYTYFLGDFRSNGVTQSIQQVTSSALALNFDLFTANFNSINKRLGELRGNPYNQGVWARVFGGEAVSNFGAKTETSYMTAQGGYDYALDLDNAKNYIGVAFSYTRSLGKTHALTEQGSGAKVSLDDIQTQGFEVAVYNSYVSNVGLYNDTIAKFSYFASDFKVSTATGASNISSPAFLLSDEVGYRFALGENNSWFIDPQVELGVGYLSDASFATTIKDGGNGNKLKANQQSVLLVRSRAGASFGKEFRGEDWATSLYVGTFYEYDVLNGGKSIVDSAITGSKTPTEIYKSNGRFVLNVGTNVEVAEATRIYLDVETNFGDTYKKLYQVNVGARYSFGDKATKATMTDKEDNKAPLKVQTAEEQEEVADKTVEEATETGVSQETSN